MKTFCRFCLSLLTALGLSVPLPLMAQMPDEPELTWEEFVQQYETEKEEEGEDEANDTEEELQMLEAIAAHPMQLNRVTRDELLRLPFLAPEQADSILLYRERKYGIRSLGELQFVSLIDYFTRRNLSLFVRCDSAFISQHKYTAKRNMKPQLPLRQQFTQGIHELETRMDIPFYRRKGDRKPAKPTPSNYYEGSPLKQVLRYRYRHGSNVAYGLTMEKDAGEPVCRRGYYPYDYLSGYLLIHPQAKNWRIVAGDYELRYAQGLLFGKQFFAGREWTYRTRRPSPFTLRPHTGTDEAHFFRGAAAGYESEKFRIAAFVSYRKRDARYNDDNPVVETIYTSGLHRTQAETERRRNLGEWSVGGSAGLKGKEWNVEAAGYFTHYDHFIWPKEKFYNLYYFRGQNAGGFSLAHTFGRKKFQWQGEVAFDHSFHFAATQSLSLRLSRSMQGGLQLRYLAKDFISLHGQTLQQGNRVANEQGALLSLRWLPRNNWEIVTYADFFRFPSPTFTTIGPGAKGLEWSLLSQWKLPGHWKLGMKYRMKTRQRTISGYKIMEYRHTHRLRVWSLYARRKLELRLQGDATLAARQTGTRSFGWMLSARTVWKPWRTFSLKGFGGLFFTDNYESAVYAYEPQLRYAASFPSFFHQGFRAVLLSDWEILKRLHAGLRFSVLHYFNRPVIGSGINEIASSWKNDLSLQIRYEFGKR